MKAYQLDIGWQGGYLIFSNDKASAIIKFIEMLKNAGWKSSIYENEYLEANVTEFEISEDTIIEFEGEK
jgi:hypothetical protein